MEAEDLAMPRFDYESPVAGWWRGQRSLTVQVLMAVVAIGLWAWGFVSVSADKKACLALARRCEAGDVTACAEGAKCGGEYGAVCASHLRTAALKAAKEGTR